MTLEKQDFSPESSNDDTYVSCSHMSHIMCFVIQECVIDKKVGKIMFMRQSLLQKLFQVDMDDKLGQYRNDKLHQYRNNKLGQYPSRRQTRSESQWMTN